MDNRFLAILAVAQLFGLGCCIESGDSPVDNGKEVDGERESEQSAADDLDTQETGWLLDEKMRKLEYLKNKVLSPFSTLKSPVYGGGGGAVYPVYGGGKPGLSYGGGFSPSFSYGANFNPSISYGASFNPGISFGGGINPGYSSGGFSGFYPGYKKKFPFIGGGGYGGYAPAYPIQPFPDKFNIYQKFNPIGIKQLIPSKPWYSSGVSGGFYRPSSPSYAPDCNYVVNRPSPTFVQPAPVYTAGTPLSSYYSTVGPSQAYGGKSAYLTGAARVSFQSSLPSPVLQVPSPQVRDGSSSSWQAFVPSVPAQPSLPNAGTFTGYAPSSPSPPAWATGYAPSSLSPPAWATGFTSYPSTLPPPQTPSWPNQPPSFPYPALPGSGVSQYVVIPQTGATSYDQASGAQPEVAVTPVPPAARGQFATALPGAVGYPGAIYFEDQGAARDAGDGAGDSPPPQSADTDESSESHSESSESPTASPPPPPPPSPTPAAQPPLLATYYTSNTIDRTRFPVFFYVQPADGGYYSSPGQGYSYYYVGSLPPAQTKLPVTPAPPC